MPVARKGRVTSGSVYRDPYNLGAIFMKLGKNLIVQCYLIAANRTPVGRIEHEDDWSSAELAQAEYLVGRRMQSEIGGRRAGGENFGDVCGRCWLCHSCLLRRGSTVAARSKATVLLI